MPQRKKTILSHVPPLVFVASPVFQPAPVLTPDLAVNNPVTAKVVAVENMQESSWVSPQFCEHNRSHSTHQNYNFLSRASKVHEMDTGKCLRRIHFKPLKFVSDEPEKAEKSQSNLNGQSHEYNHTNSKDSDLSCIDVISNITVDTPVFMRHNKCSKYLPSESSRLDFSKNSYPISDLADSSMTNETVGSKAMKTTPTRISCNKETLKCKQLKPHRLFCQNDNYESNLPSQSADLIITSENKQTVKDFIHPQLHLEQIYKAPDICEDQHNDNTTDTSKYTQNICLVPIDHSISLNSATKTSTDIRNKSVILVVDTPKCEYGLTFRQRQLKCNRIL